MDPESRGGNSPDGRTVRGTLHWVSAAHAVDAEVRLYDRLFSVENPNAADPNAATPQTFLDFLNPASLEVLSGCKVEPALAVVAPGTRVQFERVGYFCADSKDHGDGRVAFNRTVGLRDSWARAERKSGGDTAKAGGPAGAKAATAAPAIVAAVAPAPAVGEARADLKPLAPEITIDDFAKIDLRVGLVVDAGTVEGAKKLVRLSVDVGEGRPRNVFAGIRSSFPDPTVLVGRRVIVVANLKPREMKFGTSEGMCLAAGEPETGLFVATVDGDARPGDKVS
jgi:methionine--tRNA ligase beta chain